MQCMIEGCDRDAQLRGLCRNCYAAARRRVQSGKTTWKALKDAGLCVEKAVVGRAGAFRAAFEAATSCK